MKPLIFLFSFFALFLLGTAAYAENSDAPPVPMRIDELGERELSDISDGDYSTVYSAYPMKLTVTPDESVRAVYVIWNEPPEEYSVSFGDGEITVTDGIMHKLIVLSESADSLMLNSPKGGEICDIYLFRDPEPPDWVQKWEPPCKRADMLIFSAHADDELLMFGGTIPYYAKERDLRVQVVYMTTHWEEQPRPHEMLDGLWTAGVENYPVTGIIPDIPYQPIFTLSEAAAFYDFNEVSEWFVAQLRRFKPSVVVTHDLNGEYGHAAHKLAAKTAAEAAELSADPAVYPESAKEYGVWDVPKIYLHFYGENAIEMDWEQPLESFGGITAREAAELCYDKHKSQHIWGYSVNYGENWDCRQFGLYRSLVGSDTSADFMDNIVPVSEEAAQTEPKDAEPEPSADITEAPEPISETSYIAPEEASEAADTAENTEVSSETAAPSGERAVLPIIAAAALLLAAAAIAVKKRRG
ncbi:MAG: PIG-L family deacetylase [Eubacterium sp.]|nr:PIG-L family deacetylase [Eubacterium sp.]